MTACTIDHLVITAPTLDAGEAFVMHAIGIPMQPGGRHPLMGTHNRLLPLGRDAFVEVIAIDPDAPAPARPRWFELDRPSAPRLATWVARTTDMRSSLAAMSECPGPVETLARGDLRWLLTIPSDGSLPLGGVAPALIEWQTPGHPASTLRDAGCSLRSLTLRHPEPARVGAWLDAIGLGRHVTVSAASPAGGPSLIAEIATPHGIRTIGTSSA